jgi:hypothetical protein
MTCGTVPRALEPSFNSHLRRIRVGGLRKPLAGNPTQEFQFYAAARDHLKVVSVSKMEGRAQEWTQP